MSLASAKSFALSAARASRRVGAFTSKPAAPELETVWNGTKDAKGEASLIGDRPRKAV